MAEKTLFYYAEGEKIKITEKQAIEMLSCTIFPVSGPCYYETLTMWRECGFIKEPHEN